MFVLSHVVYHNALVSMLSLGEKVVTFQNITHYCHPQRYIKLWSFIWIMWGLFLCHSTPHVLLFNRWQTLHTTVLSVHTGNANYLYSKHFSWSYLWTSLIKEWDTNCTIKETQGRKQELASLLNTLFHPSNLKHTWKLMALRSLTINPSSI